MIHPDFSYLADDEILEKYTYREQSDCVKEFERLHDQAVQERSAYDAEKVHYDEWMFSADKISVSSEPEYPRTWFSWFTQSFASFNVFEGLEDGTIIRDRLRDYGHRKNNLNFPKAHYLGLNAKVTADLFKHASGGAHHGKKKTHPTRVTSFNHHEEFDARPDLACLHFYARQGLLDLLTSDKSINDDRAEYILDFISVVCSMPKTMKDRIVMIDRAIESMVNPNADGIERFTMNFKKVLLATLAVVAGASAAVYPKVDDTTNPISSASPTTAGERSPRVQGTPEDWKKIEDIARTATSNFKRAFSPGVDNTLFSSCGVNTDERNIFQKADLYIYNVVLMCALTYTADAKREWLKQYNAVAPIAWYYNRQANLDMTTKVGSLRTRSEQFGLGNLIDLDKKTCLEVMDAHMPSSAIGSATSDSMQLDVKIPISKFSAAIAKAIDSFQIDRDLEQTVRIKSMLVAKFQFVDYLWRNVKVANIDPAPKTLTKDAVLKGLKAVIDEIGEFDPTTEQADVDLTLLKMPTLTKQIEELTKLRKEADLPGPTLSSTYLYSLDKKYSRGLLLDFQDHVNSLEEAGGWDLFCKLFGEAIDALGNYAMSLPIEIKAGGVCLLALYFGNTILVILGSFVNHIMKLCRHCLCTQERGKNNHGTRVNPDSIIAASTLKSGFYPIKMEAVKNKLWRLPKDPISTRYIQVEDGSHGGDFLPLWSKDGAFLVHTFGIDGTPVEDVHCRGAVAITGVIYILTSDLHLRMSVTPASTKK